MVGSRWIWASVLGFILIFQIASFGIIKDPLSVPEVEAQTPPLQFTSKPIPKVVEDYLTTINLYNSVILDSIEEPIILQITENKSRVSGDRGKFITVLGFDDRVGKAESDNDFLDVILRITHNEDTIKSVRGVQLGGDSIEVLVNKGASPLPLAQEITISQSMLSKVSESALSEVMALPVRPAVQEFLDNQLDLYNTQTGDYLSNFRVLLDAIPDKYAAGVLGIKDQFITALAFEDRFLAEGNIVENNDFMDVIIEISHTTEKVNSARGVRLGEDTIEILVNEISTGTLTRAQDITVHELLPDVIQVPPLTDNMTMGREFGTLSINNSGLPLNHVLEPNTNGKLPESCIKQDADPDQCGWDIAWNMFDQNTKTPEQSGLFLDAKKVIGCVAVGKTHLKARNMEKYLDTLKDCLIKEFAGFLEPFIPKHGSILSMYAVTNPSSRDCSVCQIPPQMEVAYLYRYPGNPNEDEFLKVVTGGNMPVNYNYDFEDYIKGPGYAIWPNQIGVNDTPTGRTLYYPEPAGHFIAFPRFIHRDLLPILDKNISDCVPKTPGCLIWIDVSVLYFRTYNVYNELVTNEEFFSEGRLVGPTKETAKKFSPLVDNLPLTVSRITVGSDTREEGGKIVTSHAGENWQLEWMELDRRRIDPLSETRIDMDIPHTVKLKWNRLAPELSAESLEIIPSSPEKGQIANITIMIKNVGEIAPLGAKVPQGYKDTEDVEFYVDGKQIPTESFSVKLNYPTFQPQHIRKITIPWYTEDWTIGSHTVTAVVPYAYKDEHDLSNNRLSLPVNIINPTKADLSVDYSDVTYSPSDPKVGDQVNFSVKVTNRSPVSSIDTDVFFGVRGNGNVDKIGEEPLLGIVGGGSTTVNFVWNTASLAPRSYLLVVEVDRADKVAELNDKNNRLDTIEFSLAPHGVTDLVVTDVTYTPSSPRQGDAIEVSTRVENSGTEDVFSIELRTNVYDNSGNLVEYSDNLIGRLDKGTFTLLKTDFKLNAGSYRIESIVDPRNIIAERDEGNNKLQTSLVVGPPPGQGGIKGLVSCSGDPVGGATVIIRGPEPLTQVAWQGTTNGEGRYDTTFVLTPGTYVLNANHPNIQWPSASVLVQEGQYTTLDITTCEPVG